MMRGSPSVQAAFELSHSFVACWCKYVLLLHTRLEAGLDHGQGRARSGAGCPSSESSGAKVHIQPTVTMAL